MRLRQRCALFSVFTLGFGGNAMANLTFSGTLVEPPPCTINSGSSIEVDFNNMGVSTVDGVNHRKAVNYTINCAAGTLPWEMQLTVAGLATSFESSAVQSSNTDLGIKLLMNGSPLALNTPVKVDPATPPVLEAVPVKRPGASLGQGGFTASASLQARYQ